MKSKPGTPSSLPTKSLIFTWLKQTLNDTSIKIQVQNLGTGVIYCRIINHYYPNSINLNRVNLFPKNQYEYIMNLKLFQNSLILNKINLPFDVNRVAQLKFLENWALINTVYKCLVSDNMNVEGSSINNQNDDQRSVAMSCVTNVNNHINNHSNNNHINVNINKYTTKKSFQMAFPLNNINNDINKYQSSLNMISSSNPLNNYQSNMNNNMNSNINNNMTSNMNMNILSSNNSIYHQQHHQQVNNNMYNRNNKSTYNNYSSLLSQSNNMNMTNINSSTLNSIIHNNIIKSTHNNHNPNPSKQSTLNPISINQPAHSIKTLNIPQQNNNILSKSFSVGKLPSQSMLFQSSYSSFYSSNNMNQNQGKYSVNSHIIQNNYNAIIDRVKQILLKASHDIQKIRQIKMLFNIPLNQDVAVKVQEEDDAILVVATKEKGNIHHTYNNHNHNHHHNSNHNHNNHTHNNKQNKYIQPITNQTKYIPSKQTISSSTQVLPISQPILTQSPINNKINLQSSAKKVSHEIKQKQKVHPPSSGKKSKIISLVKGSCLENELK